MIFLVAFVFLERLDPGPSLRLRLIFISKREIVAGLSLVTPMFPARFIFPNEPVTFWAPGVDFLCP